MLKMILPLMSISILYTSPSIAASTLENTKWVLSEMRNEGRLHKVHISRMPTLGFTAEERVSGNAGCNHFGGRVVEEGQNISFSNLFSTKMYCFGPNVMKTESTYLHLLSITTSFSQLGDVLTFFDNNSRPVLRFVETH